jgi:hypothetical protein
MRGRILAEEKCSGSACKEAMQEDKKEYSF